MSKNKDDNNQDHNQSVLKLKEAQDKIKAGKSASAFDKLEGFFKNKAPQPKSEFDGTKGGKVIDKSAGLAAGYIYKEQSKENGEAQDTHIIKSAVRAVDLNNKNKKLTQDFLDYYTEYVTSPIYQQLLHGNVSQLALVNTPQNDQGMYIRSKFLKNFKTISEITKGPHSSHIGHQNLDILKQATNFEKVLAASLFLGDCDYHAGNLGIVEGEDKNGNKTYTCAKIDHGRSLNFPGDVNELQNWFSEDLQKMGYKDNMPINYAVFKESIDQMIETFSPEQFKTFMEARHYDLKKNGFDFKKLAGILGLRVTDKDAEAAITEHFVKNFKKNYEMMQQFSLSLNEKIISNMHIIISDLDDEQKDLKSVYLPEDWLQHQDFSKSHVNRSKDILKHLLLIGEIDCDSEVVQNSGLASMLNNQLNGKKWWLDQNFDEKNIVQYLFNLCGDQKIMKGGKSIQEYCIEKQWQPPLLDIKKEYGFNKDAETVINELIGVIENPQKREALVRRICKLVEQDSAFVKTNGADSKSDLKEQSALLYNRCMAILPSSKRHLFEALDEEISKKMGERNDGYVMKYFVQILDFIKDFLIDKKIKQDVEANKGFVKKVLDSRNNQANLQKQ